MKERNFEKILTGKLQEKIHDARIFFRDVGVFRTMDGSRVVRMGVAGQADLYVLAPCEVTGKILYIEIEVKTEKGRQSKDQKVWEKFIEGMGGLYLVARPSNVDEVIQKIKDYQSKR